jgi:DNA-binding transcriptional MerR regulator
LKRELQEGLPTDYVSPWPVTGAFYIQFDVTENPAETSNLTVTLSVCYNQIMNDRELRLSIGELAGEVELPVRTVRFYIAEGLIPGPGARGKGAAYGDAHLLRLRLVRRLVAQRVPLTEIRERVGRLALDEVRVLLDETASREASLQTAAQSPSPREYVSELLNRARAVPPPPAAPVFLAPTIAPSATPPLAISHEPPAPCYSAVPPNRQAEPTAPPAEAWQRWELVPGVELHVRAELVIRYRDLIERVINAARKK